MANFESSSIVASQRPRSLSPAMAKDVKIISSSSTRESPSEECSQLGSPKRYAETFWPTFGTKDEIPGWLRDNDFILARHPMPTFSYARSWRLWRCLHMETMNIWTHLAGSVMFIVTGIGLYSYASSHSLTMRSGDKFAFGISITAAAICFGLSTTFHTLRSHSYKIHHRWGRFDIFGICLLALGGGMSATYYAFLCEPTIQKVYWSLISVAALGAAVVLFDTGGGGSKMRTLRGTVFAVLAITALLPIFHGIGKMGWHQACRQIGAAWYLAEALTLCTGVSLFVTRIPERLSPGTFDIWGHSHQLHHICAVVGTAFHVTALVTAFRFQNSHSPCN